ncbi:hypothetical protein PMYN1_Chma664 (chromatophore) [Paulinella micropora]|uniref:DUF721 domain-containing protein n=1 Tax=Paulinella micropora TaxID=1928728 RepID=A0A1L5YCS6_9EUKA|nr:hypothetical protein PCKR_719 [Paulinella micropora]AQX45251.1 hypothetical protein PFK_719 [Paulinella micropora]BBL86469.1 hypothetical protein PMYN1_Chma664 [Paulinella micropora]
MKIAPILRPAPRPSPDSIADCLIKLKETWQKDSHLIDLLADWENIAGPQIAHHCQPIGFKNQKLIVGAKESDWLQALIWNRKRLLQSLRKRGFEVRDLQIKRYHSENNRSNQISTNLLVRECNPHRGDIHGISNCPVCHCSASTGEMARWGHCSLCQRNKFENMT